MKENRFQHELIEQIREDFQGCIVLKNDANYIQGIPDLLVLYKNKWAALECKRAKSELKKARPNQEYYIDTMNKMSYASFVYPENKEKVLDEMAQAFGIRKRACFSLAE